MARPADLRYTKSHEWLRLEGDVGVIGITDYAVEALGDLAFVDLPQAGARLARGEPFGEIESTKTVSQLYAPVSGEVIEVNGELAENVQFVSDSPYESGWMVKVRLSKPSELEALLSSADYDAHLQSEEH
jgi:glycine cleavage system H protein